MVSPIEDPFEPPFNQKVTGTIEPEEPDSGTKLGTKVPVLCFHHICRAETT